MQNGRAKGEQRGAINQGIFSPEVGLRKIFHILMNLIGRDAVFLKQYFFLPEAICCLRVISRQIQEDA